MRSWAHLDAHGVDAAQRGVHEGHGGRPEGLRQERVLDAVENDAGGKGPEVVPPCRGRVSLGWGNKKKDKRICRGQAGNKSDDKWRGRRESRAGMMVTRVLAER